MASGAACRGLASGSVGCGAPRGGGGALRGPRGALGAAEGPTCGHQPSFVPRRQRHAPRAKQQGPRPPRAVWTASSSDFADRGRSMPRDQGWAEARAAASVGAEPSPSVLAKDIVSALEGGRFRVALSLLNQLILDHGTAPEGLCMVVLSELCKANRSRLAVEVFQDLLDSGLQFSYRSYHDAMQMMIDARNYVGARQILRELSFAGYKPNVVTYSNLISSLCKASKSRRLGLPYDRLAFEVWRELDTSATLLDPTALRTGLNACVTYGQIGEAEQVIRRLERSGNLETRAFNLLLKGYAQREMTEEAEAVLPRMRAAGVAPDGWTFNTVAACLASAGEVKAAMEHINSAVEAGFAKDLTPAYTALIKAYSEQGDLETATGLLQQMAADGIPANDITLSVLVDALVKDRQMDRAVGLMWDLSSKGVPVTTVVMNNMLSGYTSEEGTTLTTSMDILDEMYSKEVSCPDVSTFNILMGICCTSDTPWAVRVLFRRMEADGHIPDAVSFTTLMRALVEMGDYEEAIEVYSEMEGYGMEPDEASLNMMAFTLSKLGRIEEAMSVLDQIDTLASHTRSQPSPRGYGAVLSMLATMKSADKNKEAFNLLQRFRQQGGAPDEQMYNTIVGICVRNRDWKRALQVVEAMERRGQEADRNMLVSMIHALEQRMQEEEASSDSMMPLQQRVKQSSPRSFNPGFERFKFWLGLPNSYYNASNDDNF